MFTGGELRERMRSDELRRRVAGTLLGIEPGQRLPTIRQLASRHRASIGATQETLARLEAEGGVAIDRRGRLGATLRSRSIGALWAAAEGVPLIVSLPLPNTPRTEGLATAIKSLLTHAGVEVYLVFSRGSRHRLVELRQGRCHLVVLSALAARELCGSGERVLLELPAPSFVREHRVYYADRAEGMNGPPRVVIDRDSLDFQRLTELEFEGTGARFVPASYMEFPRLMAEREADAVIWDVEEAEARMPRFVRSRSLSARVVAQIGDSDLRTAFIARTEDTSVQLVAKACLDPAALMRIHGQVVEHKRVPSY